MASLGLSGESRLLALDGGARGADGAAAPDGAPPQPDPGCLLERVAAVTLDAAAAAHLAAGALVALIKVDAEGAGREALEGARGVLRRDRPQVVAEVDAEELQACRAGRAPRVGTVSALLAAEGYACVHALQDSSLHFVPVDQG
jgi:hypothetical protein